MSFVGNDLSVGAWRATVGPRPTGEHKRRIDVRGRGAGRGIDWVDVPFVNARAPFHCRGMVFKLCGFGMWFAWCVCVVQWDTWYVYMFLLRGCDAQDVAIQTACRVLQQGGGVEICVDGCLGV